MIDEPAVHVPLPLLLVPTFVSGWQQAGGPYEFAIKADHLAAKHKLLQLCHLWLCGAHDWCALSALNRHYNGLLGSESNCRCMILPWRCLRLQPLLPQWHNTLQPETLDNAQQVLTLLEEHHILRTTAACAH